MDFCSPDHDKKHVHNSEPSIALVKSDSCDLVSHSTNRGVTRGYCGRSNEDQTAKIKEEMGMQRRNVVHLSRATWQHRGHSSIIQRIGRLGYFAMNSSINRSYLLRK